MTLRELAKLLGKKPADDLKQEVEFIVITKEGRLVAMDVKHKNAHDMATILKRFSTKD